MTTNSSTRRSRALAAVPLLMLSAGALAAQSASPTFELISIRPVETNGKPILMYWIIDHVEPPTENP